jgi:hypothetical protein
VHRSLSSVALACLVAGCGGSRDAPPASPNAALARPAPCDPSQLRATGEFQGASGSLFGVLVISNVGDGACYLHGGRPRMLVTAGASAVMLHERTLSIPPATPRILLRPGTRTTTPHGSVRGVGFYLEWLEPACIGPGPVVLRVRLPGLAATIRVHREDRLQPRCDYPNGGAPADYPQVSTIVVSPLDPDLAHGPTPF